MIHKKIILKSIQSIYNVEKEIFKDHDDYDSSCIFNVQDQLILFFLQYTNNRFISFLIIWMATTSINQKKKGNDSSISRSMRERDEHTFSLSLSLSRITITQ